MKLAIFSDLHAHPFKPYATIRPDGMNSRLWDIVDCIKQITKYCKENNICAVLFGGDLFHVRGRLSVVAFNAVYAALEELSRIARIYMIHGNHDQADREGEVHSIYNLRAFCTIVDKPGWVQAEGPKGPKYEPFNILAVPYTENIEHLRELAKTPTPYSSLVPKIFLGHLGIKGAKLGADYVYSHPSDAGVEDLNPTAFDACFLGHYHLHQQLASNVWYIGAPLHHNWGDKGQQRGFLVYDTESRTQEQVPLAYPQFFELSYDAYTGGTKVPHDSFVRVVSPRPWSEDEKEQARIDYNARSFEIVEAEKVKKLSQRESSLIRPDMSMQDMLLKWVAAGGVSSDGLDHEYLMQLGMDILEEVALDA